MVEMEGCMVAETAWTARADARRARKNKVNTLKKTEGCGTDVAPKG